MPNADDKSIRLLLVLPFFYPHRGGSQKYAEEIYATMMKNHSGVSVDVLCYNTDQVLEFEKYRNFRVFRVPCWNILPARFALAYPWSLIRTLFKLSKNKYQYVNTHIRFFDPTWWLWAYAKIIGAKSIFTGHVASHPIHQSKIVELVGLLTDLTVAKLALKFYDYITFTNATAQKFFKDRLGVKKPSYLVYGGVDTNFFKPSENKSGRIIPKLGKNIPDNAIIITFVGRLIWTKGVTFLYDAAKKLCNDANFKDAVFVFAGPGELEKELSDKIRQDGLQERVFMTGNISYTQVRDLLSITDIFINPSHHNEGFPNTVLEGGSAGAYVIATDNAGTWEVIRNGKTGQLIPQRNVNAIIESLTWAVKHPYERNKIAQNFRKELVEKFDWNVISEQLYNILKEGLE